MIILLPEMNLRILLYICISGLFSMLPYIACPTIKGITSSCIYYLWFIQITLISGPPSSCPCYEAYSKKEEMIYLPLQQFNKRVGYATAYINNSKQDVK